MVNVEQLAENLRNLSVEQIAGLTELLFEKYNLRLVLDVDTYSIQDRVRERNRKK